MILSATKFLRFLKMLEAHKYDFEHGPVGAHSRASASALRASVTVSPSMDSS